MSEFDMNISRHLLGFISLACDQPGSRTLHMRMLRNLTLRVGLVTMLCAAPLCISLAHETAFPLKPVAQERYLEDSHGRPFLLTGDSAWSLIADLSFEDALVYLKARKSQGFNTIITSLIEHQYAREAPANFYGEAPFIGGAFETVNDRYFERASKIIKAASDLNMLVLLCPTYLGASGGPEGWYVDMVAAGPSKLAAYGRYIGRRFASFPNVIWLQGGDFDPPDQSLVDAVAQGIRQSVADAVQTIHANRDTVTDEVWRGASWISIDTVYTYDDVASAVLTRYRTGPARPFFLIEGKYEGEHGVGEMEVRLIAYSALLSGAGGQVYGNNPVWHFAASGLFASTQTWRQALSSPGAASISSLVRIFERLQWWTLVPDQGALLRNLSGFNSIAMAARDVEGEFAVIYVRDRHALTLNLDVLAPGEKHLCWYDPSNGELFVAVGLAENRGAQEIMVPRQVNGSGFHDWVGVLRSAQSRSPVSADALDSAERWANIRSQACRQP